MGKRLKEWRSPERDYNIDASSGGQVGCMDLTGTKNFNSKAVVGTVSGANCFDFDGQLKKLVDRYLQENPECDPWSDEGYKELYGAPVRI